MTERIKRAKSNFGTSFTSKNKSTFAFFANPTINFPRSWMIVILKISDLKSSVCINSNLIKTCLKMLANFSVATFFRNWFDYCFFVNNNCLTLVLSFPRLLKQGSSYLCYWFREETGCLQHLYQTRDLSSFPSKFLDGWSIVWRKSYLRARSWKRDCGTAFTSASWHIFSLQKQFHYAKSTTKIWNVMKWKDYILNILTISITFLMQCTKLDCHLWVYIYIYIHFFFIR